ncbi:MAG: acyl-CoA thioesterase [Clostridiales Family XIII bacterium]|jgi:acyl-CoA thioester hydrolase|nr:acyl-CoA thioesterase [Clostridiales Family XIII bacterium]
MARKFYSEIRVIYADTDAMGIAYHGNYVKWFEIGRTEFLRQLGYPYAELERQGIWLLVTELGCRYRQPARYDDVLEIACWAEELGGASVVMSYEVRRKGTGELLVTGFTRHAVTGPDLKPIKLKQLKPVFHAAVAASMGDGA